MWNHFICLQVVKRCKLTSVARWDLCEFIHNGKPVGVGPQLIQHPQSFRIIQCKSNTGCNKTHFTEFIYLLFLLQTTNEQLYRVIKKSLCTWRLYCNHQVHRDFLITLFITTVSPYIIYTATCFDISMSSSESFTFVPC